MKKVLFVILFCNILGCKHSNVDNIVNDNQLVDIIEQALLISKIDSDKILLYQEYQNQKSVDSLIAFYSYGSNIFGYEINDSIVHFISDRLDKPIPQNLDDLSVLDIKFISDTVNFNGSYIFISEPFFIDQNKLLFLLSDKKNNQTESWVYFLEKKQESFKVISFFDFQKDKLYMQK